MKNEEVDIAIVGGGVSGVYCAWRLKKANPKLKIVVLEGSSGVGGRLLSVRPPGIANMVAELGGMRILPAVQPLVAGLIEHLNKLLPKARQIAMYDFPVDEPQNLAYLRGEYLRLADFTTDPDKVPYHLTWLERGQSPGGLIVAAIEQLVPGITDPALTSEERQQMAQAATFAGRPLYEQGFWNVLLRIISPEAFQLGVDAGGYSSTLGNWNAADAIPWFLADFGVTPKYRAFCEGFQQVPLALAALFEEAQGDLRVAHKVRGVSWHDGAYDLPWVSHDGTPKQQEGMLRAKKVILAMPRRALDLLAPGSPPLQACQALIASVTPRPLFKLFTTYTSPWWRNAGYTSRLDGQSTYVPVEQGRTVTDMPVRQTYYWPTVEGKAATTGPAMLMASYDDGNSVGYWDGLRPRRHLAWQQGQVVAQPEMPFVAAPVAPAAANSKASARAVPPADPERQWETYQASAEMVAEVARQLSIVHDLPFTPEVQQAAFRDWGDDPFGGGWNSWNIGVKSWEVKHQIVQPNPAQPLYICGEAYSDAQGWVEGALQTADYVLAKFGLDAL
ncbi:MAG: FAD-dependent oxidoreductase [Bacteroidota bacterium]|nr:FAD-dependent oxidoreductase [Bacteroidota bacterium]